VVLLWVRATQCFIVLGAASAEDVARPRTPSSRAVVPRHVE
jgi:hypothetical protein